MKFNFEMFDLPNRRTVTIDVSFIERRFSMRIMKSSPNIVIPLHHRPDLKKQCCNLLNSEWKRSETSRLRSLSTSKDSFPTCLILINTDIVLGHCKISEVPSMSKSCMIESGIFDGGRFDLIQPSQELFFTTLQEFIFDPSDSILAETREFRNRGLGSLLMKEAEDYMRQRGIENVYLMTKGQEDFYKKNGYHVCEPADVVNSIDFATDPVVKAALSEMSENQDSKISDYPNAPPPPPLPNFAMVPNFILNSRTFMMKKLVNC